MKVDPAGTIKGNGTAILAGLVLYEFILLKVELLVIIEIGRLQVEGPST